GAYAEDPVSIRRALRAFKGKCRRFIGIDPDEAAGAHPGLDEFRLIEGSRWPLEDDSVDVCICDYVLEHVEDPEAFIAECQRVLKPGGHVCIRTANAVSYIGVLSRLVPNRLHVAALSKVRHGRNGKDVFPTRYRCNTGRRVSAILRRYGFDHCVYRY